MKDRYGNEINIGDRVVFSTNSLFDVGVVVKLNTKRPTIKIDNKKDWIANPFPRNCIRTESLKELDKNV